MTKSDSGRARCNAASKASIIRMSRILSGGRSSVIQAVRRWIRIEMVSAESVTIVEKRGSKNLFALKFGRAPFEKSPNPFAAILGEIAPELFLNFVVESASEILLASGKQLFLHRANGQVRALGNFLRQLFHFRFKMRRRNDVIDNPECERGFRVNHVSGVEKLGGFGGADQLRQKIRSAKIGEQSALGA